MKTCMVYGDLTSDRASEAYPTEIFCDDCFEDMEPDTPDTRIVSHSEYDSSYGDTCVACGKTKEDEDEENAS